MAFQGLPFRGELISKWLAKQLAQLPKELLNSIRSYLMLGWEEVIAFTYLKGLYHVKYLKYQLRGPNAKNVVIALQNYIRIYCIKTKHDKKHKAHEDYIANVQRW